MTPDDQAISNVLQREGGRNDRILLIDPGGPTNRGVTLATFSRFLGRPATQEQLWALTEAETREIYDWYIRDMKIEGITDPDVRELVIDLGVLHGALNARRMLQRALGVKDDGAIGPKTIAAMEGVKPLALCLAILAERAVFFGRLITKDLDDLDKDGIPDNTEFAAGWLRARLGEPLREIARRLS